MDAAEAPAVLARARQGDGELAALLAGPDTWQVS